MKYVKNVTLFMITGLLLAFTACEEDVESLGRNDKTMTVRPGGPGDKVIIPDGLPYPDVDEKIFTSSSRLHNNYRCRTWRITWPNYDQDVDPDEIHNYFAISNSTLYSFNYIMSIDPAEKQKLTLALYNHNRVISSRSSGELWGADEERTKKLQLIKHNEYIPDIENLVTARPDLFQDKWEELNGKGIGHDFVYEEGDFFMFAIPHLNRYGGIRIVSMSPRTIEVYYAEPTI